jgi:4,5-dihydroxyphthalate decarboxylase
MTHGTNPPRKLLGSFHRNPRVAPLFDGTVKPDGLDIQWTSDNPGASFLRVLTKNDFDVFEFSISHYMVTRNLPDPAFAGWIALPVFASKPSGIYRGLYVREASGIRSLADLRGKRVGIPDFSMTGGVAIRAILRTLYGIHPREIQWMNTRRSKDRHDNVMGIDQSTSTGITITNIAEEASLQSLLERGELDAAVSSPEAEIKPAPGLQRYPLDAWVAALADMQRATGFTPVNHTLLVQKRLLAESPDIAGRLLRTFESAKQAAYASDPSARAIYPEFDLDTQRRAFGDDPYPYGFKANRRVFELVAEQLLIDGIISARPDIDALVAESVRDS